MQACGRARLACSDKADVRSTQWDVAVEYNDWSSGAGEDALVVGLHIVDEEGDIYSGSQINQGALPQGNVSVDPEFANPAEADWHLQPGSPMIDKGVDAGLPYCGAVPDLGAFASCPLGPGPRGPNGSRLGREPPATG